MSTSKTRLVWGSVVGFLLGALVAVVVGNALVEISVSAVFSIIFGVVLIILGSIIIWRAWSADESTPPLSKLLVTSFAVLVFLSGIFCFVLERDWVTTLTPASKVPMYLMLGISLCFAVSYSLVDLLNQGCFSCGCVSSYGDSRPIITSPAQVYLILTVAMAMGAMFGLIFGLLDVEDEPYPQHRFAEQQIISIPIGAVLGAVVGFLNQKLRQDAYGSDFDPLSNRGEGI